MSTNTNPKILIVDDEPDILNTLENILIGEEFLVKSAQDGREAISIFKSESFDLVITDIKMPGMKGTEVVREIHQLDEDVEVIILTGFASIDNAIKTLRADGAFDYLTKPLENIDDLIHAVNRALEKRKLSLDNKKKTKELTKANEELRIEIKERKQAEKALKESEEKYRLHFENVSDVIYSIDPDFRVISVSPAVEKSLGYKPEELIGKPFQELNILAPDYLEQVFADVIRVLNGEKGISSELEFICKNGKIKVGEVRGNPVIRNGKIVAVVAVARDITERKAIEEEKKTLENKLRQAHKMESIGTLAGGIAHDFNNILSIIVGNTELAIDDVPEWNPAHFSLKEIKTAGLRAAEIVKQLISFSRKTDQNLKPIRIITIVKDSLNFLRSSIPTSIEIRRNIPAYDETIFADPIQINQVLMNLCINASQAMEETGGILEISVSHVALDVKSSDSFPDLGRGDYIQITVGDTGPGIDPEIIGRIFDPYFTTKEIGKGSGMGLAVVHGIVKNHGGAITVDSQPGEGTTFTILFPVAAEKPVTEAKASDEMYLGTEAILFVDDEESIANLAGQMLVRLGYTVETRTNPVEALELFQSEPDQFDLVITDMTMPRMTGARLSEKLKEVRSDIPVIICTGHSSLINEEKAKKLGIAAFVMKPIVKSDIAKTIRKVLDAGRSKA